MLAKAMYLARLARHTPRNVPIREIKSTAQPIPVTRLGDYFPKRQRWLSFYRKHSPLSSEQPKLPRPEYPSMGMIIEAVCRHYRVRRIDVLSNRRTKDVTTPRHVAMYLGKKLTLLSTPQIGRALGHKDHSTVLNGVRKIERLVAEVEAIKRSVEEIEQTLKPQDVAQ